MPEDVQALMSEAEAANAQNDWDKAIELYQSALEADPTNEEACSKLAELFAIRGLLSNVIDQYFTLMDILDQKEEHELAVEVARWIMKLQPENDKARMKTILIFKKKGNMEEVVRQSLQLARLYIELGQGDQSILLLKNAQEIAPDNLDIGLELAEMYISHGHIPEGTAQYKKIANAYLAKGNHEKAAEAFRRMKVIQPDEPQLLFTLGNLYMSLGRLNEAEAEFRAILRHNLNHTEALMALGNVCQKKGQFRDAILAFNKILSINPENEIAKEKLGELYQAQGATNEAVKYYLQAASTYQYDENVDRAIKLYQIVISIDPTNPTACRELTNLGASLVSDDMEGEAMEDAYSPIIAPMEVDEEELELAGPSLEEMAGAIVPPTVTQVPTTVDDVREEAKGGKKKRGRKKRTGPVAGGAVPSAFDRGSVEVDVTALKKETGAEFTYAGNGDESDITFEEEVVEEPVTRRARKPKSRKYRDLKKKKLKKKGSRGLVKKGLFKKAGPEKKKRRPGLLSGRGKPSLGRKGLVSRKGSAKGLFKRKGMEEEVEEMAEMEKVEVEPEMEETFQEVIEETPFEPEYEAPIEEEMPQRIEEEVSPEEVEYEVSPEEVEYEVSPDEVEYEEGPREEAPYEEAPYEEVPYEEAPYEEEPLEPAPYAETAPEEQSYEEVQYEEPPLEEAGYEEAEFEQAPYEEAMFEEPVAEEPAIPEDAEITSFEEEPAPLAEELEPLGPIEEEPYYEAEAEPIPVAEEEYPEVMLLDEIPEEEAEPMANELPPLPEMDEMALIPEPIIEEMDEEEKPEEIVALAKGKRKGLLGKKKKSLREALKLEVPVEEEALGAEELPPVAELPEMPVEEEIPEMAEYPEMAELPDFSEAEFGTEFDAPVEEIPSAEIPEDYEVGVAEEDLAAPLPMDEAEMLPPLEEAFQPAEDLPPPMTDGMEIPPLDMDISEIDRRGEEFAPPGEEEITDISAMQALPPVLSDLGAPSLGEEEKKPEAELITDFEMDMELPDLDFEGEDMFDFGDLPPFDTSPTKKLDLDDFTSSLLKLADEIEMIMPDEDRIKEFEEKKVEAKEEEAGKVEAPPGPEAQSTKFLEFPDLMTEEITFESLPPIPGEMVAEKEEAPAVTAPIIPETVMLPPLEEFTEMEPLPGIVEEIEAPVELEIEDKEVMEEVIEEPPLEPELDISEKVHVLIEANNLGEAFPLFKEAIEMKSDDFELIQEHADLCYDYGKIEDAIQSYKKILERDPSNYEVRKRIIKGQLYSIRNDDAVVSLLEYGNVLTGIDKVEEAQRIFQYVLALQKENPSAREALSEIYLNLDMKELALYHLNILAGYMESKNEVENAIKVLKKIFTLTSSIKTQEKLARVYIEHNYTNEAIEELTNLADRYEQQNKFLKAASNYEKIVEMEPEKIEAHKQLIDLYEKLKDQDKSYFEKVLVANLLVDKNEMEKAQERYEECLKIRNNDNEVRRKLVDIYLKRQNLKRALEESKILSQAYHKERKYGEAIKLHNELIDHDPRNLLLREKLSEFYVMSDQLEKGLNQLILVAEELSSRDEWDGAIKAYKKALTIDNKNSNLHYRIGEIFLNQKKNNTEARFEFAKVYELDSTHRKAMENLVRLYLREDKPGEAIKVLKSLKELDSSYKSMQDEIIKEFKEKIKADRSDTKAHFNLGMIYKELEMWTKAIEQFQQTRKSNLYVLESHALLGICFSQQPPMRNLAVKTLEKGLRLKGFKPKDYIDLHYQLALLYESMKKSKKAKKELEAVLAIDAYYKDAAEILKRVNEKV